MSIASNLERLRNQVADACARAHRDPATVALMAVSKMHPAESVREAYETGQRLFGENRVQEWQTKRTSLSDLFPAANAHLIGPLQNNKTAKAAEIFDAIDTLDSLKTAERLNAAAQALGKTLRVLIEVKLSHEDTKHGLAPEEIPTLLRAIQPMRRHQLGSAQNSDVTEQLRTNLVLPTLAASRLHIDRTQSHAMREHRVQRVRLVVGMSRGLQECP